MGKIGRPPYLIKQTTERIKADWITGRSADDRVPSENKLASLYDVSRTTVRSAMDALERGKLLVRKPRVGYFVASYSKEHPSRFFGKEVGISFSKSENALRSPYYASLLAGLLQELRSSELNMMLPSFDWRMLNGPSAGDFFKADHIVGVVLINPHASVDFKAVRSVNKPLVAIDFDASEDGVDSFCFDDFGAGVLIARRLHGFGHRRIAAVFEDPARPVDRRDESWYRRREGLCAEMKRLRLVPPLEAYLEDRGRLAHAAAHIAEWMKAPKAQRPTGIILPDARFYPQVQQELKALGLSIPEDLSIFAFGPMETRPLVTAVRFDGAELGKQAAERLISLIVNLRQAKPKAILRQIKGQYVAGATHRHALD